MSDDIKSDAISKGDGRTWMDKLLGRNSSSLGPSPIMIIGALGLIAYGIYRISSK